MESLFEWNWLGFSWAILIGGQLAVLAVMFIREATASMNVRQAEQRPNIRIDIMAITIVNSSILLGLLTIFVWDFRTTILLVVATSVMLAFMFLLGGALARTQGKANMRPE